MQGSGLITQRKQKGPGLATRAFLSVVHSPLRGDQLPLTTL
ncbi:hypothetical protein ACVWY6_004644 [Williamsia sp. R60]